MSVSSFFRQVVVFSLAAIMVTSVVSAQEGGGGGRGRGGFGGGGGRMGMGGPGGMMRVDRARLLEMEKVRAELKIEEAQAATIDAALEAYREQRSSGAPFDRDAFGKMTEEERTVAFEKMQKEREELSKSTDEVLNALLEEGQKTRLDQITVQIRIAMGAFGTLKADDMKTKLSLTEEQLTKLTEAETVINEERTKAMEEMRNGGSFDFQKMGEKMAEFQKKSTESAMALLTDDQKKMVTEMTGAEFKIEMRDLMGRPPGGGGPGGGRGGAGGGGRGRGGDRPKSE
jgi:hypothetical protein